MQNQTKCLIRTLLATTLLLALLGGASVARADAISFQLSATSLSTTRDGTVTFIGTITNNSGGNLNANDFFFNFFGFNPASVNPIQDLGIVTNFLIPKGTTSSLVPLFDVTLGSVAAGSNFPIQIQLEDINTDLSTTQTVTVSVPGTVPTLEPSVLLLLAAGLFSVLAPQLMRKVEVAKFCARLHSG